MAKTLPPLGRLADLLLREAGGIAVFISEHRQEGKSWDWIATELYRHTDGQVYVTDVTVQSWAQRLEIEEGAA